MKQKVLVWYWGRRGGGARYTIELLKELLKFDEFEIHTSFSKDSELYQEVKELELPNFDIPTYNNLSGFIKSSLSLPFLKKKFREYLFQNKIELVFCSMNHLWNFYFVRLLNQLNIPFLLAMHDAVAHEGENYGFRNILLKKEVNGADHLIALTSHVKQQIVDYYAYSQNKISVIPHGYFEYAKPLLPVMKQSGFTLLYFGRILPYKGPSLMIKAFKILKAEYKELQLIIAGNGDKYLLGDTTDLDGIEYNIRWIKEEEVQSFFDRADLVVTPYIEASQSGVIPTAYASSIPVVSTPVGGLQEQVVHNQTGLITKDFEPKSIADSIQKFIDSPAFLETCSKKAKEYADKNWSWSSIASQMKEVIQSLLKN